MLKIVVSHPLMMKKTRHTICFMFEGTFKIHVEHLNKNAISGLNTCNISMKHVQIATSISIFQHLHETLTTFINMWNIRLQHVSKLACYPPWMPPGAPPPAGAGEATGSSGRAADEVRPRCKELCPLGRRASSARARAHAQPRELHCTALGAAPWPQSGAPSTAGVGKRRSEQLLPVLETHARER